MTATLDIQPADTTVTAAIESGDVIEFSLGGEVVSALVLLAADDAVILDACDGSTPFVIKRDELVDCRRFEPTP